VTWRAGELKYGEVSGAVKNVTSGTRFFPLRSCVHACVYFLFLSFLFVFSLNLPCESPGTVRLARGM
jgi:hypothetical protein